VYGCLCTIKIRVMAGIVVQNLLSKLGKRRAYLI
jgi:hypothetical protein